jgi:hypothetical protein
MMSNFEQFSGKWLHLYLPTLVANSFGIRVSVFVVNSIKYCGVAPCNLVDY